VVVLQPRKIEPVSNILSRLCNHLQFGDVASGTLKKTEVPRRMLHLSYTRRDLPQQLVQADYLTQELYNRMSPVQRYLLEIEPPKNGDGILRQPKREHKGWWN
jgi:hypothetical protein